MYACMYGCMYDFMFGCMRLSIIHIVLPPPCFRCSSSSQHLTPGYILTCIATTAIGAFLIGAAAKLMITHKWGWNLAMVSECC